MKINIYVLWMGREDLVRGRTRAFIHRGSPGDDRSRTFVGIRVSIGNKYLEKTTPCHFIRFKSHMH
jgi:hypothetical protein